MDRQPDRVGGLSDAALDALADPPPGVGRELEAFAPIELSDGADQSEVAVLDQIHQRITGRLVLRGERDDEAQVPLHERAAGIVAGPHRPAQGAPTLGIRPTRIPKPRRASAPASISLASRASSSLVSSACRPTSVRYKGDEFVVVVPDALRPGHDDARLRRPATA